MAEWSAPEYSRINSLQEWMGNEQLKHVELGGSERVLDVGCGDGKITAKIAARLPHGSIVGVDPSHSMIDYAAEHYATEHHGPPHSSNARFEVGDARLLGFSAEFDFVVSFNALHWVLDQQAALSSIRAALKPGGRALLRMVSKGDRKSIEAVVEETRGQPRWANCFAGFRAPFVHFTPNEYRILATNSGLAVQEIQVEDRAWDFETREAFFAFCRVGCIAWLSRLPENDWPVFLNEALDRYQVVAANAPDAHVFKFYQMQVALRRAAASR
jgi:trans-aconitate methyltransferase